MKSHNDKIIIYKKEELIYFKMNYDNVNIQMIWLDGERITSFEYI